ncbi:FRG domain-containing protein [Achromobacter mucicolens]|uniref:FRG domain-containing protein n=1 Tax=Achromobacter mucicolens TaxID=1389922 RepID=UPI0021CDF0E1|nr:FRG domain-containing protein [Achromobacter mucicolens]MCU6618543.1 FRG domain-containing protein [Achromobacter mucicolens]
MSAWTDFLNEVRDAERDLGSPLEPWYRGHTDHNWLLVPSLPREEKWEEKEKKLFFEFSRTASRLFEKRTSDWETLFDMQHYWVPTRLLDWTTVMGVAIAFILHGDYTDTQDSALFILDPVALNRLSGRDDVINVPDDKAFDYKTLYWEKRPVQVERPLSIRPSQQISDRLRAQKGTFTVYGTSALTFEVAATNCYRKVILPAQAKAEAREFLRWANLDEYTIYPDIVGMAHHIKHKIL